MTFEVFSALLKAFHSRRALSTHRPHSIYILWPPTGRLRIDKCWSESANTLINQTSTLAPYPRLNTNHGKRELDTT